MARLARQFLYGFLGGVLLSLMRAPAWTVIDRLATSTSPIRFIALISIIVPTVLVLQSVDAEPEPRGRNGDR